MRETEYTYAVARIRANEPKLLTQAELNAAVAAPGYEEAARRLKDKGYAAEGTDISDALQKKSDDAWALLTEILPDGHALDSLLIGNDFQNLKVMLKSLLCGKDAKALYVRPSVYDPAALEPLVFARENDKLPPELQHADRSAYHILTKTRFAQLSDSVIDRAALEWAITYAKKEDPVLLQYANDRAALTDLKILYRCIRTNKTQSFVTRCVCACEAFSKETLAATDSLEALSALIAHSPYAAAGDALKAGAAAFEKCCDDMLTETLRPGRNNTFGVLPLAAYWHAVQTEILNVRILLSAKLNGIDDAIIKERMRTLYV